ncbi:MAG: RNA polymerase factor sigma-54 [Rhodospirillales bacterium]|nr:RNA polymerase factor sigma-54 [Rhodospirillales bacterium]
MVLGPRLDQRQSQSLVMTPQLQQAIKLLQMSNMELMEFVETELEKNPLLERDEGDRRDEDGAAESQAEEASALESPALEDIDFTAADPAEIPKSMELDAELDNTYTNDSGSDVETPAFDTGPYRESGGGGFDGLPPDLEQTLSEQISLRDHLMRQIGYEIDDPTDRIIGIHLIDQLDDAGYIREGLDGVAEALGCPVSRVEAALAVMQQLDPPGIFARDLRECLTLQLQDLDRCDPCMQALLANLDMLASRNLSELARVCQVDAADLGDMILELKALNPKPATAFDHDISQPITPDVLMRAKPGGGWVIELNAETLPRVLVNNHYHAEILSKSKGRDDKTYIMEQFHSANWLVKSLHQRATTILKVATELVIQQDMFFRLGVQHLKPLVLRDIAEVIEMHESTVSRVTSNKYMSTPRGIFELKYFFTSSIGSTSGGEAHSAEAVRYRIKTLIDAEPAKKILSDDKIVAILKAEGMDIARRTVAKYRESMRIPSSVQRRRDKASPR